LLKTFLRKKPKLGWGVYLAKTAVMLGVVALGAHSSVWYGTVVRGAPAKVVRKLTPQERVGLKQWATLRGQRRVLPEIRNQRRHAAAKLKNLTRISRIDANSDAL